MKLFLLIKETTESINLEVMHVAIYLMQKLATLISKEDFQELLSV